MAKRRDNGEGNIRKRKDGRWEDWYTAGHNPAAGKAIYIQMWSRGNVRFGLYSHVSIQISFIIGNFCPSPNY